LFGCDIGGELLEFVVEMAQVVGRVVSSMDGLSIDELSGGLIALSICISNDTLQVMSNGLDSLLGPAFIYSDFSFQSDRIYMYGPNANTSVAGLRWLYLYNDSRLGVIN
jgi:hypothetical protein